MRAMSSKYLLAASRCGAQAVSAWAARGGRTVSSSMHASWVRPALEPTCFGLAETGEVIACMQADSDCFVSAYALQLQAVRESETACMYQYQKICCD